MDGHFAVNQPLRRAWLSPACFSPASLSGEKLGRVMEQRDGSPVKSRRQESVPKGQEGQDHVPAAPELPSDSTTTPPPPALHGV